jgi:hypothetical protein
MVAALTIRVYPHRPTASPIDRQFISRWADARGARSKVQFTGNGAKPTVVLTPAWKHKRRALLATCGRTAPLRGRFAEIGICRAAAGRRAQRADAKERLVDHSRPAFLSMDSREPLCLSYARRDSRRTRRRPHRSVLEAELHGERQETSLSFWKGEAEPRWR